VTTTTEEMLPTRPVQRQYVLDDLHVRADGTGRIVEAYAAVFNTPAEIQDQDGHYIENLEPTSFDRTIRLKGTGFGVLFNHGLTINGTPNPVATMPIGVPVEVKPDGKGVFTATRYLDNPLADQVLDGIRAGAIRAQSFSGRYTKSKRDLSTRARSGLPTIHRLEVDMREYGPAVFAAYTEAAILGTRSVQLFARALLQMDPDKRLDFLSEFEGATTPLVEDSEPLEQHSENRPAAADDPAASDEVGSHSARQTQLRDRIRIAARTVREKESAHGSTYPAASGAPRVNS
jgi:HK97 family phage prohead protease